MKNCFSWQVIALAFVLALFWTVYEVRQRQADDAKLRADTKLSAELIAVLKETKIALLKLNNYLELNNTPLSKDMDDLRKELKKEVRENLVQVEKCLGKPNQRCVLKSHRDFQSLKKDFDYFQIIRMESVDPQFFQQGMSKSAPPAFFFNDALALSARDC